MTQKNKNSFLNNKSKAQHVLELTLVMPLLIICFCFVFQMMVETYAKYKFSYAFTNAARQLLKNRPIYDSLDAMGLDAGSGENVGEYDYVGVLSDHLLSEVGNIPFTDIQIIPIEGEQRIYLIGAYQLVEQMIFGQTGSEYFYFFVPVNKVYTRLLVLYYSDNCFGTTDAISFRDKFLRIHDFKSGSIIADMRQLKIYAALSCLEYRINPFDIKIELRIYQNDDVDIHEADPSEIKQIMEHIIECDRLIENIKRREG